MSENERELLVKRCESFMTGAKRFYDGEKTIVHPGDMWFFELYHHLNNCAIALKVPRGNTQ